MFDKNECINSLPVMEGAGSPGNTSGVIMTLLALSCLLINIPWGYIFSTDMVIPEYSGWLLLGLALLAIAFSRRMVLYRSPWLLLSFLTLSLPLLWMMPHADVWRAISRVLLMWCGGFFFLWLAACRLSLRVAERAGNMVVVTGVVCAFSVLLYVLWPAGYAHWLPLPLDMRASGGFRQVNVMASFLATALSVCLVRWLFSGRKRFLVAMAMLMMALTGTQSTVELLGAAVAICLMTIAGWHTVRRRLYLVLPLLCGAWGSAKLFLKMMNVVTLIDHENSWSSKVQMWRAGMRLIADRPFTGQGYGMFEGVWPQGIAALHEVQLTGLLSHPHNELLYWGIEGGLVAGVGIVFLLVWGVRVAIRLWQQASAVGGYGKPGSDALGWGICSLPLLLHTQTEYPWYQSPAHYVLFLFLAGMAVSRMPSAELGGVSSARVLPYKHAMTGLFALAGAGVVYFSLSGTAVRMSIDAAKLSMVSDTQLFDNVRCVNPWFQPDEQGFVLNLHQLQSYNADHNSARLGVAEAFFQDYLLHHPDPNVYAMYIQALALNGKPVQANQVYEEARQRVGWDNRFLIVPDEKEKHKS
ncbi:O-antigen ligase C-terminal domain-containing protein [Rahnella aceris]|uniref:PglL family O-oligosaccharyltransferase n=1 Tax=Rahnella sp. (strain Y9602) TaxID=2703885 RepID=UPI001C2696D5|nr:Wzy polymerase domain-containing protein [Rahnella aceris]MBU9839046.1 O-antigen ligase C-terminal domain-containing protein [Rahnella aceris]